MYGKREIDSMTLDQIEKELAEYRKLPVGGRTVNDAMRIRELNLAANRIRRLTREPMFRWWWWQ